MKANVTYWLDRTAELYPNKTAFADAKKSVTFDQMRKQALRIATELTRRNLFKKPVAVFLILNGNSKFSLTVSPKRLGC